MHIRLTADVVLLAKKNNEAAATSANRFYFITGKSPTWLHFRLIVMRIVLAFTNVIIYRICERQSDAHYYGPKFSYVGGFADKMRTI